MLVLKLIVLCLAITSCKSRIIITQDDVPKLEIKQEVDLEAEGLLSSKETNADIDFPEMNIIYSNDTKYSHKSNILGGSLNRFTFACTAPYATRWKSNVTPKFPAAYQHAMRLDHNPLEEGEEFDKKMFVSSLSKVIPKNDSDFVECEEIIGTNEPSRRARSTRVYIYTLDGPYFSRRRLDFQFVDTRENFVVPCSANYPNVTATIIGKHAPSLTVKDAQYFHPKIIGEYDPTIGFLIHGYEYYLSRLACEFGGDEFYFDNLNPYIATKKPLDIQFHIGNLTDDFPLGIYCSSGRIDDSHLIRMIQCDSQDECNLVRHCLRSRDGCVGGIKPKFTDNNLNEDGSFSWRSKTLQNAYSHGMVQCLVEVQTIFTGESNYIFTGLDHKRYWLSEPTIIPEDALIRITEVESVLYTNKPTAMECAIVNFLIVPNIRFALEYENGTKALLDDKALNGGKLKLKDES